MASDIHKHLDRAKRLPEKNRAEDAVEAYLARIWDCRVAQGQGLS